MSEDIPQITGPGRFAINVAGESYHLASFEAICGPRCEDGVEMEVRAQLTLQDDNPHDKHAVRVDVLGHQVGHLPREVARDFRRAVRYGKLSEYEAFECAAIIRGGWDRGGGDAGHYGVRLDLPQDDD